MGKPQTEATKRYAKKAGLVAKSFKLKKSLCDRFKEACEKNGESQAAVITAFMNEYIEKTEKEKN